MTAECSDLVEARTLDEAPTAIERAARREAARAPVRPVDIAKRALHTVSRHLRSPHPQTRVRPQINVSARNARWFLLGMVDSATVSNADESGVAFRKRDPEQFRTLLLRTITLHRRLIAEWAVTAQRYRAAIPDLTSVESWNRVFDQGARPGPGPGGTQASQ